jgi:hypothetical protein
MTRTITIPIEASSRPEPFERADRNVIQVRVQLPDGTIISTANCIVEFNLSHDAMVGLGTELLRAAHGGDTRPGWELFPADRGLASQCLGVFLHPNSCRLNVWQVELGPLEKALE